MFRLILKRYFFEFTLIFVGLIALCFVPIDKNFSVFGDTLFIRSNLTFFLCFGISMGFATKSFDFIKKSKPEEYLCASPLTKTKIFNAMFFPGFIMMTILVFLAYLLHEPKLGIISFSLLEALIACSLFYCIQFSLGMLKTDNSIEAAAIVASVVCIAVSTLCMYKLKTLNREEANISHIILIALLINSIIIIPGFILKFISWDSRGISMNTQKYALITLVANLIVILFFAFIFIKKMLVV